MIVKVPLSWLRDYADAPWPVPELVDRLAMAGLEVEAIEETGTHYEGVVVGRVQAVAPHPGADRLRLCTVDVGDEVLEIVCGAPNVSAGQRVPVARVGAVLPGGVKIKRRKIRGVVSRGMICSEKELEISDEADVIMVLDGETPVGRPFTGNAEARDTVLSIDVTTNRSDCLGLVGIAREVAAMTRSRLRMPEESASGTDPPATDLASVTVQAPEDCPRFAGRVITGVRIAPSPAWLARRLEAAGIRAINNVVDVTNYVMLELGQPLHAYDLNRLAGREIIVRRARDGQSFTTLDGVERTLTGEILMIADRDQDIGVAGVMGGLNTEITDATTEVFLEGACFDAARVRRGARRLGMDTDASRRFERGVDPGLQARAVTRAAALIEELTGGAVAEGVIDVRRPERPAPPIRLRVDRVNALLGTSITREEIAGILKALEFTVEDEEDLIVHPPSFRPDVTREADLIEEVARLYGYDRIAPTLSSPTPRRLDDAEEAGRVGRRREEVAAHLRDTLIGCGCTEVMTHSFVRPDALKAIDPTSSPLTLKNPISADLSVMRTTLAVTILEVVRRNVNRKLRDIRIFEIGRVFHPAPDDRLPREPLHLCVALTGRRTPPHWSGTPDIVDFFDIKGLMECTLARFALDNLRSVPYDGTEELYDPERSASIQADKQRIGAFGAVARPVLDRFDIEEPVWLYQLDCDYLTRRRPPVRTYRTPPKYPAVERDMAIVVPESVDHRSVVDVIRRCCGALLEEILLFDVYRGKQIPDGKKSLAYALRFRASNRTLTDGVVSSLQAKTLKRLETLFEATLRR